jgi:hypothetical protein
VVEPQDALITAPKRNLPAGEEEQGRDETGGGGARLRLQDRDHCGRRWLGMLGSVTEDSAVLDLAPKTAMQCTTDFYYRKISQFLVEYYYLQHFVSPFYYYLSVTIPSTLPFSHQKALQGPKCTANPCPEPTACPAHVAPCIFASHWLLNFSPLATHNYRSSHRW